MTILEMMVGGSKNDCLMKRVFTFLAVSAILFVSCAKETEIEKVDENPIEEITDQTIKLSAAVNEGADTKVSADLAGNFSWKSGDAIAVLTSLGNNTKFTTTDDDVTAEFTGTLATGDALGAYAVYPYSAYSDADGKVVTFSLPSEYEYVAGETNMPMLGKISAGTATFKAVGGVLKLTVYNVPADAKTLDFIATANTITGDFTISDATVSAPTIAAKSGSDDIVEFDFTGNRTDNMIFYIPLPVGDLAGFTVEFYDGVTKLSSKTVTKTINIARNSIFVAPTLDLEYSPAQELYSETWGTSSVAVDSYDKSGTSTFDSKTDYISYSVSISDIAVNNTSSATLPDPANLFFPGSKKDAYFTVEGIKLNGASKVTISYLANKTNLSLHYKVDSGAWTSAKATSSTGANSYTINSISGTTLGLKFTNTSTANNRLDDIVVTKASAGSDIATISIKDGDNALTMSAGNQNVSVREVKLSNPWDANGISFVIDPADTWITGASIVSGNITDGDAVVRITCGTNYNHGEDARVGHVYFRANGASSKTITVTQNPSIVAKPTLDTPSGTASGFEVTWTGDSKAKSYVGYYFDHELDPSDDPTSGTPLKITNEGSAYTATQGDLDVITEDETYYFYIKVNEVGDSYKDKYVASSQWATGNVTCTDVTDYSTTYTSGITLSTDGGTAVSTAKVVIGGTQYDALKAGASGSTGIIKITIPSGATKLHLHMAAWSGDETTVTITPAEKISKINNISTNSITPTSDSGISGSGSTYTLAAQSKASTDYYYVIDLTGITTDTELTFTANANKRRFVIWGVNAPNTNN